MNDIGIDCALIGQQHEILGARLVALGMNSGKILGHPHACVGNNPFTRLQHKILQCLEALVHLLIKGAPFVGVRRRLKRGLQCRLHGTAKDAVERIVVGHGNRIVFMFVAAGAGNGEPHQAACGHVDAVIKDVMDVAGKPRAQREEAQGRERGLVILQIQLIGGELLDDEPVKWLILVERANDVIAIGPGPRKRFLLEKNIALVVRIAGDIQPVTRPVLAVLRRVKELIDQFGMRNPRLGFEAGRQAGEDEMCAAV